MTPLLSAYYRSASWKMEVMTKHIIGKAIICSTNHFTVAIWAVFQQCNFQISLSTHISLSLIPQVHHIKWNKGTDEMWPADVETSNTKAKVTSICTQETEVTHGPAAKPTPISTSPLIENITRVYYKPPKGQGTTQRGKDTIPTWVFMIWDRP